MVRHNDNGTIGTTFGGDGNDILYGGAGSGSLTGYYGSDRLNPVDSVSGNDSVNSRPDSDTCTTDSERHTHQCP
ncbi:hypothetical protein ACF05T_32965 [Streptomyces lateritius]|uniref:Calcium-binding protein n=1 Tax=Streptomyces lateritius TaxID=67313 RepID=A0ABW6YLQ1_9ACTN